MTRNFWHLLPADELSTPKAASVDAAQYSYDRCEDIGKEIGQVFEWHAFARQYPGQVLDRRDSVVPMFGAPAEEQVPITRNVASTIDVG